MLAGPFSNIQLFLTDKKMGKWVNTLIKGCAYLFQLKDVGAPIVYLRVWQENETNGDRGNLVFESEVPLNFKFEKLSGNFTAIQLLENGEHIGIYFNKGVSDCSIFNMHLTELNEQLQADDIKMKGLRMVAKERKNKI